MRRGSVVTYADDGRRHSAGMVAEAQQRRSSARQQFALADIEVDTVGGCYVSHRKVAFVFVFFLALLIGAAFVGVYVGMPPYKDVQDALVILAKEEDAPEKFVLAASIRPLLYRLELRLPGANESLLRGRASLEFAQESAAARVDQLVLNSKRLRVREVRLRNSSGGELALAGNRTDEEGALYVLLLKEPLRAGNHTLELDYELQADERVLFSGRHQLASRLKPENAPRLFPTLDEAHAKTSFALTLLHPPGTTALSNAPPANRSADTRTSFERTPPMLSYNLAFVTGRLQTEIVVAGSNVTFWAEKGQEVHHLRDKVAAAVAAFSSRFRASLENKLDVVALPLLDYDGLSAPGLIVVRDSLLLGTAPGAAAASRAAALLKLLGLVAQQWFGGLVDARNWTDAWYLEGSAIYFQYALLDEVDRELGVRGADEFLADVQFESMESDGYVVSKALGATVNRSRIEAFDLFENYQKGACLIRMLRSLLNDADAFDSGYAAFLKRWRHGIADSDEFLRAVAGNASVDDESGSLLEAFAGWTRYSGYPVVNVTWNRDNGSLLVRQEKFDFDDTLDEEELQLTSEEESLWWIPLTYVLENSSSSFRSPALAWLKGEAELLLEDVAGARRGNDSWLLVNVDRRGYYRVNYDEATWRALGAALLRAHMDFPAATRASLIDDAFSLARQGGLAWERALELVDYAPAGEREYLPWRALARSALLLEFALYETPAYPSFQEYMRTAVSLLFDEMQSRIELGTPLALLAARLACLFEYPRCSEWARTEWQRVRNASGDGHSLPAAHAREIVYCFGARRGDHTDMRFLMERIQQETSDWEEKKRLLSALGCFQTPWLLQRVLNEMLASDRFDAVDAKLILDSYAKNPAAAQAARRFVQDNWQRIVRRFSGSYWTIKAFIEASTNLLFNDHDLNEFNNFRDQHIDSLKAMGHWVALNEVKASAWISRLKQSSNKIQKSFKSHAG